MPYNDDICRLVIENIALLEEAPLVIEEIEKIIFEAINNKFKKIIEKDESWKGVYSYHEDDDEEKN